MVPHRTVRRRLDLMPRGRNEEGALKGWVRRHDEYE
jgi:predicted dithiol-disulfide oxidoreductase (DUF899 family)